MRAVGLVDDVSVTDNWVMARHYVSHLTDTLWQTDAKVQTAVTVTNVVSIKRLLSRILSYVGNNVWRPTQNRFYGRHFPKCWPTWIKFVRNLLHGIHLMHIAKNITACSEKKTPCTFLLRRSKQFLADGCSRKPCSGKEMRSIALHLLLCVHYLPGAREHRGQGGQLPTQWPRSVVKSEGVRVTRVKPSN